MNRRRAAKWVSATAAAAVLIGSGAGWATVTHYSDQVQRIDVFSDARPAVTAGDPLTVLVVGSDSREGLTARQQRRLHTGPDVFGQRTDTIMLMHLSASGAVTVVSIPRDSLVTIPAYTDESGVQHSPAADKVNAAFAYGGPQLLVRTVEDATDLQIDHYLEVNFAGFVKMVNALGGVEVCTAVDIYDPPSGLTLSAGRSTLKGRDALSYVRARYFDPSADIGRVARQQAFVAAMIQKAISSKTLLDPSALTAFLDAALGSLRVDEGVDRPEVFGLAARMSKVDPAQISFRTMPIATERPEGALGNVVIWDGPGSADLLTAIRDDTAIPDKPRAPRVEKAPSAIRVQVVGDLAAAEDFRAQGYYLVADPIPGEVPSTTRIEYDPVYDVSLKTLAAALPGAEAVAVPGLGSTFRITLGSDYTGVGPVSVADPTAPKKIRTAADDICS